MHSRRTRKENDMAQKPNGFWLHRTHCLKLNVLISCLPMRHPCLPRVWCNHHHRTWCHRHQECPCLVPKCHLVIHRHLACHPICRHFLRPVCILLSRWQRLTCQYHRLRRPWWDPRLHHRQAVWICQWCPPQYLLRLHHRHRSSNLYYCELNANLQIYYVNTLCKMFYNFFNKKLLFSSL